MAFQVTDPVLLTIVSKTGVGQSEETEPYICAICRGSADALKVLVSGGHGGAGTMFELAAIAHQLGIALNRTEPLRRGRN
jgi:hypothetical protein